jgi:hypothetical protein
VLHDALLTDDGIFDSPTVMLCVGGVASTPDATDMHTRGVRLCRAVKIEVATLVDPLARGLMPKRCHVTVTSVQSDGTYSNRESRMFNAISPQGAAACNRSDSMYELQH